jgi:glutathione S-transferase
MALKLYYHPLSSFCWKSLIALYENDTPFEPVLVDLGDEKARAAFYAIWPIGKFPVLRDETRDWMIPESSIIIEYLAQHHPGRSKLLPADPDVARQVRMRDRVFDLYIHMPMQRVVAERRRPKDQLAPHDVEQARTQMRTALAMLDHEIATKQWAMGDSYTMADCAASPALFYADKVGEVAAFKNAAAYLDRLKKRPSFARVLKEAEPYFHMFPAEDQ